MLETVVVLVLSVGVPTENAFSLQEDVPSQLSRVLELNRSGKWAKASELAEQLLQRESLSTVQRAEALTGAAYARVRLGDAEEADAHLGDFDKLDALPESHWSHREVRRLRESFGEKPVRSQGIRVSGWNHPEIVDEDDFWVTASPAETGLPEAFVDHHRDLVISGEADAMVVVHRGRLVDEWSREGFELPCGAMSSTKSIASLLVGQLLEDGCLKSIDQPVHDFLPEWAEGVRKQVTIRHLLNHTSGLLNRAGRGQLGVGGVGDKNAHVRGLVPDVDPGSRFSYSNEGVQLLSPILEAAAGEPLHHYAQRRLFEPLGMRNTRLRLDPQGHAWTYADLITTPRDLARIGWLMVRRGEWAGESVVDEDWIQQSIEPAQKFDESCGLLWWLYPETESFAALGYLGTDIHVFPSRELVVVRVQRKPGPAGNPGSAYRRQLHQLVRDLVSDAP